MILAYSAHASSPLRLHPENPRIFEFRGEATILRTFGEHYGSVIHPDFDYIRYLDILQRDGMNLTRIVALGFRGHELPGQEPLSPSAAKFMQPWARVPGHGNALDGQPKWDFSVWNESYFTRLRNFAKACSERGVVAEISLFNTLYDSSPEFWKNSPFNPANNVQGHGPASQFDTVRMVDANLLAAQEAAVRRIVRELNAFDNIYYEIQNEPFWNQPDFKDNEEVVFHNAMLAIIRDEETNLPKRHLVAHNFPEYTALLSNDFDVINCHYPFNVTRSTLSPVIGGENLLANEYAREKPLSLDESSAYDALSARIESWMFILGGGAVFSGLDAPNLQYTIQNEAGDVEPAVSMRRALRHLGTYSGNLHLAALRRNTSWIAGGIPSGARLQGMASPGRQYVAYLHHGAIPPGDYQTVYNPISTSNHTVSLQVALEAGTWKAVWTRPEDLAVLHTETFTHAGGNKTLQAVIYQADAALRIDRTGAADLTPPPEPKSLAAGTPSGSSVQLAWAPVTADDLAGYRIYHSTTPGVAATLANRVAEISAAQPSFAHGSVAMDSPHHYVVTAVDQNGNESSASREVVSRVAGEPFGSAAAVPGTIQCEDFDTGGQGIAINDLTPGNAGGVHRPAEDVDLAVTSDAGGGFHVSGTQPGEWLNYTLDVAKTDTFDLQLRCLAANSGASIRILVDDETAAGPVAIPANPAWQTVTIPELRMNEGRHVLRLEITAAGVSGDAGAFNWMSITPRQRGGPNAIAGPDRQLPDADWNLMETVTLDASGSVPGDHPITSHAWMENDALIATGASPAVTLTAGTHRIQLVTTDSTGITDTDEIVVTVSSPGFVNGSFESTAAGWSVVGNVVFSNSTAATQGAKTAVFNDAGTNPNGELSQTFATVPGQLYRIRFDMGVYAFNTLQQQLRLAVTGNNELLARNYTLSGTGGGTTVWSAKDETFTADGTSASVVFRDLSATSGSIDLLLDNVRITRVLANGILPDPLAVEVLPSSRKIRITSPDTGNYRFQRSADLANWITLEQRPVSAPGLLEFTDTSPAGARFFYRIGLDQ